MTNTNHHTPLWAFAIIAVIAIVAAIVYAVTYHHVQSLHQSYLLEKATLTAQKNYERDELPPRSYDTLISQYARLLPSAVEVTVDSTAPHAVDTLLHYMGPKATQQLLALGIAPFQYNHLPGTAIHYPDNEGSFYVLVFAQNTHGLRLTQTILAVAALLLLLTISLLLLATRWQAAYHRERLFVSGASHQLANPLTAIHGECELSLRHPHTTSQYQDSLLRIQQQSERMQHTLAGMLLLANSAGIRTPFHQEEVDLLTLCSSIATRHPRTVVLGNTCTILTNPSLLEIMVENLVSNACKYSQDQVQIILAQTPRHCTIQVCDHGIGIPKGERRHIFSPFYRARNARTHQGSGIGLAIASQAASILRASIKVQSLEGHGTTFKVKLPISPTSFPPRRGARTRCNHPYAPNPTHVHRECD